MCILHCTGWRAMFIHVASVWRNGTFQTPLWQTDLTPPLLRARGTLSCHQHSPTSSNSYELVFNTILTSSTYSRWWNSQTNCCWWTVAIASCSGSAISSGAAAFPMHKAKRGRWCLTWTLGTNNQSGLQGAATWAGWLNSEDNLDKISMFTIGIIREEIWVTVIKMKVLGSCVCGLNFRLF